MASSVPFDGSNWAMPLQFEPTANGGTCSNSCHADKTYDRTKSLPGGKP
jgi:hypothetical protein